MAWLAIALCCGVASGSERLGGVFAATGLLVAVAAALAGSRAAHATNQHAATVVPGGGVPGAWAVAAAVSGAFAAGCVVGVLYWGAFDVRANALERAPYAAYTLNVTTDATPGRFGSSAYARVVAGEFTGTRVRLNFPKECVPPELGERVEVRAKPKAPPDGESGRRMRRSGVSATLCARTIERAGFARGPTGAIARLRVRCVALVGEVGGPGGDLLAGVLLGDRRRLQGTEVDSAFRTCGLTHLVAVSGGHLAVTAGIVAALLAWMGTSPPVRFAGTTLVAFAYVVFTGAQPSAIRSAIMAALVGATVLGRRRGDALAALAVTAAAMAVWWPPNVFDLGFQLSCAAVTALVGFGTLAREWARAGVPWACGIGEAVALTLVAQAATVPITTPVFGQFSVVAPVANAAAGPLVELGLATGLVGLCLQPVRPLAVAVLRIAALPLSAACWVAERLASLPGAAVPGSPGLVVAGLCVPVLAVVTWAVWPAPDARRARVAVVAVAVASVLLAAGPPPVRGASVVALDVGQGDAILVRDGSHAVLVDTGPSASAMRTAIARAGVRRLDAVVVTHLHDDHTGGIEGLRGLVGARQLLGPAGAGEKLVALADSGGIGEIGELKAGDSIAVGRITLSVLWPDAPVPDTAENRASVIVLATLPARDGATQSALLTGDGEADVLDVLAVRGALPDIDVLKVGHHGSVGAVDEPVLAALRPERAVISVGAGNRFGHPRPETLAELESHAVRVERTDELGDITILPTAGVRQ